MSNPSWLVYSNAGATRNQPLGPRLINAMDFLGGMGVTMNVFSGGQPASGPNRVGSHRHDYGNAADVFFSRDGRRLDWANATDRPVFQDIVARAKAAGVTGFGAGPGYMQPGSMHLGFGSPAIWGAGGSGANAPDWLQQAYGQPVSDMTTPTSAPMGETPGTPGTGMELLGPWGAGGRANLSDMPMDWSAEQPPMTPERFMMGMIAGENPLKKMVINGIGKLFGLG